MISPAKPRIFSVSADGWRLLTRHTQLAEAGFDVFSAGRMAALNYQGTDLGLIIVGHSIPRTEKSALIAELRKRGCEAAVLSILRPGDFPIEEADEAIG